MENGVPDNAGGLSPTVGERALPDKPSGLIPRIFGAQVVVRRSGFGTSGKDEADWPIVLKWVFL